MRDGLFSLPVQGEKSQFHVIVNTKIINQMWGKVQHAAEKQSQQLWLFVLIMNYTKLLAAFILLEGNLVCSKESTSIMGEADFRDECSNGRSSAFRQVTSPTGNLDPYLPALPTERRQKSKHVRCAQNNAQQLVNQGKTKGRKGNFWR